MEQQSLDRLNTWRPAKHDLEAFLDGHHVARARARARARKRTRARARARTSL